MMLPRKGFLARGGEPITAALGGAEFYCSRDGAVVVVIDDVETTVSVEQARQFADDLRTVIRAADDWRTRLRGDELPSASSPDGATRILTRKPTRYTNGGTWRMRLSVFRGRESWTDGKGGHYRKNGRRKRPAHVPASYVGHVSYPQCGFCSAQMRRGWVEAKPVPWEVHPPQTCEACMAKAVALGMAGKGLVELLVSLADGEIDGTGK